MRGKTYYNIKTNLLRTVESIALNPDPRKEPFVVHVSKGRVAPATLTPYSVFKRDFREDAPPAP